MIRHQQDHIENWDLPKISYSYQKCMFVDSLTEYIRSSQLCSLLGVDYLKT